MMRSYGNKRFPGRIVLIETPTEINICVKHPSRDDFVYIAFSHEEFADVLKRMQEDLDAA